MAEDNKQNQIIIPSEKQSAPYNEVVETYAGDMAEAIGGDSGNSIKKIIDEAEDNAAENKNLSPENKKNQIFLLIGFLLFIFALILATVTFIFVQKNTKPVVVQKQFTPLVFNDSMTSLEVSGLKKDEIIQNIFNEISKTKVKAGGVEGIYLTENKQTIGLRRFIALIESHFTPNSNTLFVSDNFLLGVANNKAKDGPSLGTGFFVLFKVRSATDIFDNLRVWEPNMFNDLHGLLGVKIEGNNNYLLTKGFQDGIIENKNARILYDKAGNIVLMYLFAGDNSVLVTDSQSAAHEIILRLASSQIGQ